MQSTHGGPDRKCGYNNCKLLIFITNYVDELHAPSDETLEDRIGARPRSRLYEMCRTVRVGGEDNRRRFDVEQGAVVR